MSNRDIPERDWKILRSMKDEKLDVALLRIFEKIEKVMKNERQSLHKRYLSLWKTMRKEDRKISRMFDDLKRSNAINMLIAWRHYDLLSDEELAQFSERTRATIEFLTSPGR